MFCPYCEEELSLSTCTGNLHTKCREALNVELEALEYPHPFPEPQHDTDRLPDTHPTLRVQSPDRPSLR